MKLANTLINTNTLLAPNGQMDSDSVFVLLTVVSIYHLKGLNHHQMITCDWGKTTFFGTRHFLVSVLAKLDALKYGQWVPGLIKQCRIGLYIWCIVEAFIVFFFNVVHITLYSTVLKRVTLQAKWVQSRTAVMKIDIMNQIGQRSEYHCAVNTADGKAKDLRWMLILSSWLEWQHLLNNPERQKFRRLKDKQWIRQERGIRSPNSPSL